MAQRIDTTCKVVITGTGAITSLGTGAAPTTDRWIAGESGIVGGFSRCADFDPAEFMTRKEMRRTDRVAHLAVAAVHEALAEAAWESPEAPYPPSRVGCVVGTTVGGMATQEEQIVRLHERGPDAISAMTIPMVMFNSTAGHLALRYGWLGPSLAVSSACASGGTAIGIAIRMIQAGDADAMVAGASEAAMTEVGIASFRAMEALSPTGRSLPFDARRDGLVMGEGAGAIVLESAEAAEARGARIIGEVLGYGSTGDGHHIIAPDPQARGATRAIELAMEDSGITANDIDYVNAHGTATRLNDRAETLALKQALGGNAVGGIPVSSTKSAVGHLLAAAGIVEAVATIQALRRRKIPPTVGYEVREADLDLDYVPVSRPLEIREGGRSVALSNAFGFGGHNVVVCLAARHE